MRLPREVTRSEGKKLHLEVQGQVSDLGEVQGALVRETKSAWLVRNRSGKSSLLVAEEFRFEESVRKSPSIHFDKGTLRAWGSVVDGFGHVVFARPGLPRDEYCRISLCDGGQDPKTRCISWLLPISRPNKNLATSSWGRCKNLISSTVFKNPTMPPRARKSAQR